MIQKTENCSQIMRRRQLLISFGGLLKDSAEDVRDAGISSGLVAFLRRISIDQRFRRFFFNFFFLSNEVSPVRGRNRTGALLVQKRYSIKQMSLYQFTAPI